jgi:hypothetical protein
MDSPCCFERYRSAELAVLIVSVSQQEVRYKMYAHRCIYRKADFRGGGIEGWRDRSATSIKPPGLARGF